MARTDLSSLSHEELRALRKDVDKAIETYDKRKKQEALAAADAAAKEAGYSLAELVGNAPKKDKAKVNPPKYRHPENPAVTWTGRGRQPAWIKEGLAAGKSLDDFAIAR